MDPVTTTTVARTFGTGAVALIAGAAAVAGAGVGFVTSRLADPEKVKKARREMKEAKAEEKKEAKKKADKKDD